MKIVLNIMENSNFNIAVIQNTLSRNAGGLFYSVKYSMKYICKKKNIKVFSIKDNFSEIDEKSWKPLDTKLFKNEGNRFFKYSSCIESEVLYFKPRIIHVHGLWEFPTRVAYRLLKKNKIPYIISPRGMLDKWALNNSKIKKLIVAFLYEKRNLKNSACIHALCYSEYKSIRRYGLTTPVAIIPNGITVQPKSVINNHKRKEKNKKQLLFLGRIHPKKGIKLLIQAINELQAKSFTENWEVIIGGWDDKSHLEELKELCFKSGVNSLVKFIGPVYGEAKHNLLLNVDAFILPSFSEGLPMSVLEAFSYRLPVLMTKECNITDAFKYNAAIEIETNVANIVDNLKLMNKLTDNELLKIANNGYDFVKLNYSWNSISDKMIKMYEWCLNKDETPSFIKLN